MSYELEAAARYRKHAGELRAIAKQDQVETTRRPLLQVALEYEAMAVALEEIDKTNRVHRNRYAAE